MAAVLHGDQNIVGRTLTLDHVLGPRRQSHVAVVGVMPQRFEFPTPQTQFWMPLRAAGPGGDAAVRGPMLGRLADGVSIQAAAAEVGPIVRGIRRHAPRITYELVREQDELVAPVKPALLVLTVAVGFVLLIACVNVANLLLARTATRQREIAIRVALGAGRGRLIRQLLTESVMLALLGGIGGIALALGGVRLLQRLGTTLSRFDLGNSLAFRDSTKSASTPRSWPSPRGRPITGVLFGFAPALRPSRPHPIATLRDTAGSSVSGFGLRHRFGVRNALVVTEIAMAMVLLVGGGLLMTSFVKLSSVDPGYNPTNVLTFQVGLPVDPYPDARLRTFAEDLVARLRSVPGVQAAALRESIADGRPEGYSRRVVENAGPDEEAGARWSRCPVRQSGLLRGDGYPRDRRTSIRRARSGGPAAGVAREPASPRHWQPSASSGSSPTR